MHAFINYTAAVLFDACMHGEPLQAWRHACNEANGRKLIAAHLTIHLNGRPFLARGPLFLNCPPPSNQLWLPNLVQGTSFGKFLPKSVWKTTFGGGTDFGVTDL